jgi:hypothetical protein
MPDPKVLCRLVDLISTRISMSPDPVTVVSRWVDTHNTSTLQNIDKSGMFSHTVWYIAISFGLSS